LKPENFLFENDNPNALVKLVDFGLSTRFGAKLESRKMYTMVGTPYYVAPEVL